MDDYAFEVEDAPAAFRLRPYQTECIAAVGTGWSEASRQLIVLAGGLGKTVVCAFIAKAEIAAGGRVLFIAHTEELIEQAQDKFLRGAGVESDREKADCHASPYASCVVASVQTLARIIRLTGFSDDHFTLVIIDEAHRGLSPSHLRVKNYFHFGAESLMEGWVAPEPGVPYTPKAKVLGVTATPSRGDRRSLGEFYQRIPFEYGLLEAVREGYLVRPMVKNIPLKIDMRGIRTSRSANGSDLDAMEIAARMMPVLREIAREMAVAARDLKTVVFMPSIETARLLADVLREEGLNASFVSGACDDRDDKIAAFRAATRGSVLCNAQLVVEGFDVPDIDGVCVLRPTKVWSFAVQAWVRGTRTLTGLIDHLDTKEERLAAIAASAKPCFYIIDFLWLADQHDLITPIDLVCQKPEVKEKMEGATDLVAAEEGAQRDFLKALAKAAKKHARKAARVIDPLAWAVSLGDTKLATYEPESRWEEAPPTPGQLDFIRRQGMATEGIKYKGLATKIIGILMARLKLKLATASQLHFMKQLGLPENETATLTSKQASELIDNVLSGKKSKETWKHIQ